MSSIWDVYMMTVNTTAGGRRGEKEVKKAEHRVSL